MVAVRRSHRHNRPVRHLKPEPVFDLPNPVPCPTETGYYWARHIDGSFAPTVVYLTVNHNGRTYVRIAGFDFELDPKAFIAWSPRLTPPDDMLK